MDYSTLVLAGAMAISAVVGILTGVFGVGGGFLLTPALMILLGVDPAQAVGTGLALFLVTSTVGIFKRRGSQTVDYKLALCIGTGTTLGVLLGHQFLVYLQGFNLTIAGREVSAIQYVLMWAFFLLLLIIALLMYFDKNKRDDSPQASSLMTSPCWGPRIRLKSLNAQNIRITPLFLLGVVIGVMTGLMGIGGGVLLLPALIYMVGQSPAAAAGTSLALVWISSAIAVILNCKDGHIHPALLIAMIIGGVGGTYLGTIIGLKLAPEKIRCYFVYVTLVAAALVGYKIVVMTLGT